MKRCLVALFVIWPSLGFAAPVIPSSEMALYDRVKLTLAGKGDHVEQTLQRLGDRTINIETFISAEADAEKATKILGEPWNYGKWALPSLNNRPSGGSYRIQVESLSPSPSDSNLIGAKFQVNLPLLTKKMERFFQ